MTITAERKTELIKEYATAESDTGSPEVQVAILTERINNLTEHMKTHEGFPFPPWASGDGRAAPTPAGLCEEEKRGSLSEPDRAPGLAALI